MKKAMSVLMVGIMVAATGCKSLGPTEAQATASLEAYKSFIKQQRSYDSIKIVGSAEHPAKLTMEGTEITISSALPALSALGNDDTRARAFESLASVLRMGVGAAAACYGFSQFADSAGNTVNNYTQPATPAVTP